MLSVIITPNQSLITTNIFIVVYVSFLFLENNKILYKKKTHCKGLYLCLRYLNYLITYSHLDYSVKVIKEL